MFVAVVVFVCLSVSLFVVLVCVFVAYGASLLPSCYFIRLLSLEPSFISFCLLSVRAWNGQYNLHSVCKCAPHAHTPTHTTHTHPRTPSRSHRCVCYPAPTTIAIRKCQIYNKNQKVWISNFCAKERPNECHTHTHTVCARLPLHSPYREWAESEVCE